ncbi:MAG: class I SAM-dependent methyltransferase family protein [Candidatus Aenigmatarchaeota archaeon]
MNLKETLRGKLTDEELSMVPRSFDLVGDVAIIEIPEELSGRRMEIALALQETHKRIKAVCNKKGERAGDFRLPDLQLILGDGTETVHTESGCRFKVDVRKAYFSEREGTERQRIGKMIRPGEEVLVMFSGICPSPIIYAKVQPKIGHVYGVDINPDAHRYALENIRLNKVSGKVTPICGDVRKEVPKIGRKFDRITMPLPKDAHEFLDVALAAANDGGIIHFYHVAREGDLYAGALKIAKDAAKKAGKKVKILDKRKVLPYGPRVWKVCVEFRVQ